MSSHFLLIIDMQNDFIDGPLGSEEAVTACAKTIKKMRSFEGDVIFTKDTHTEDYLDTFEGRNLPVPHCIRGTHGWELNEKMKGFAEENGCRIFEKPEFGSISLVDYLCEKNEEDRIEEITLTGLCTDICVITNAVLLRTFLPETPLSVDSSCCAGVTPKKHLAALDTMESCQIHVY